MARARNIKPGFFRNADLVELPVETRLLFIGLWTLADREGRLEDRPKQIKIELFPADSFDVGSMLTQLQSTGFINRYEIGSLKFIEVENFIKHQDPHYKEKASEIPPPPGRENFMRATAVTRNQRLRILDRDGHACVSCGAKESLCMDHILPISRGGDSSDDNLQVLCSACNTKKGNKIDGEEKNSRKRRVNVESRLNQINDASPSDSRLLTPDSLIPDSLIPDSFADDVDEYDIPMPSNDDERSLRVHMALVKPKPAKAAAKTPETFETPDWINRSHWDAWHSCAKRKKATPEQRQMSIDKLSQWRDANLDYAGALENAAVGGYQGLFLPSNQVSQAPRQNKQEALEARNRQIADDWVHEMQQRSAS